MFNHIDHGHHIPKIERKTTEAGRKYFTPEGNTYPSITTVCSILNKDAIMEWRKRVGEEEANKISRFASSRGTAIHKMAEDYINNDSEWKAGAMPHNLNSFGKLKTVLDKHLDNIWLQEVYLYSDRLKCAGQVDCIAEWDGVLSVVDFKTSRKPKKVEWVTNYFIKIKTHEYLPLFLEARQKYRELKEDG
jgi:hypothetical protein